MSCMFVGDVGYAVIGASGELYASPLLDLPFLLGFTMLGASALHPSAADMVRVAPLPIQAWSWPRLLVLPTIGPRCWGSPAPHTRAGAALLP